MSKRAFAVAMLSVLLCGVAAFAEEALPDATGLRIGLVFGAVGGDFAVECVDGARSTLEAMGAEVLYSNAAGNRDRHLANMETVIQMEVNGIITGQTLMEQFMDIIDSSMEEGIPVITLDGGPSAALADVTANQWIIGIQQALTLFKYLPTLEGNIIEFFNPGYLPCDMRYSGFRVVMDWYPGIKTLAVGRAVYPNTVPEAKARMEAFLQQYPEGEINAVVANYDQEGIGALQAILEAGRDEIIIIGADGEPPAIEAIRSGGPYKASVRTEGYEMGKQAALALVKYILDGTEPAKTIFTETTVVSEDNIDQFLYLLEED